MQIKNNRKIVGYLLIFTSAILLIAANNTSQISLYTSKHSSKLKCSLNKKKSIGRTVDYTSEGKERIVFLPISVVVKYDSKTIGDTDTENPIVIDISDKDLDFPWLPIYKKAEVDLTLDCTSKRSIDKKDIFGTLTVNGNINYKLNYRIIGFCSRKKAKNLILSQVMNDIYKEVKKAFQE